MRMMIGCSCVKITFSSWLTIDHLRYTLTENIFMTMLQTFHGILRGGFRGVSEVSRNPL